MTAENVVFLIILVAAAGFFALNVQRLARYMRVGYAEDRNDRPWSRLKNVFTVGIAQSKILRDRTAGAMHATIFWGFIVLTIGTIEILIQGVFPRFAFDDVLARPLFALYVVTQDLFAVLVLGAVAYAFYRRLVLRPKRLEGDRIEHMDAYIILGMIGGLMVTLLVANAFLLARDPSAFGPERFASQALAVPFSNLAPRTSHLLFTAFWWAHALLIL